MKPFWTILLVTLALVGCQPPVRLMPTPAVFAAGELNPFKVNNDLEKSSEIEVFYATNRLPIGPAHSRHYTVVPSDDLHMGVATLNIGGGHKTWDWLYRLSTSNYQPDERPALLLDSMNELAAVNGNLDALADTEQARAFFQQINDALARSTDKDLTIYVHGANTSVERAAGQAAQYRHFTGRNSVVMLFAWPSAENFMRFAVDVANARTAGPRFTHLLELLAQNTNAEHINVIAYSSGAMVASPGLARLQERKQNDSHATVRLGEVYYPAPDANFRAFTADLMRYVGLARRVTVAVNLNDTVLTISRLHQRTGSRAGRPDITELSPEDSQWLIQTSKQNDFDLISVKPDAIPGLSRRSHTFWYDNPWVSSDVLIKLMLHAPPAERGLEGDYSSKQLEFWTFPPDYDARMPKAVHKLTAATHTESPSKTP